MKNTISYLAFITLISCTSPSRFVANTPLDPPSLENLLSASEIIYADVSDSRFSSKICVDYLAKLERQIDSLDITSIPKSTLMEQGQEIADNSWKIRKTLHARLPEFNTECSHQLLASFRQLRFIEEYLLEIVNKVAHKNPADIKFQEELVPIMENDSTNYVLQKASSDNLEFSAGDMLVTRGVSFLSSMIARLGERGTQYSHIVFVHQDAQSKETKTIESYVGVGVAFYDLKFALKNENARILWLRAKDQNMAHKANDLIGNLVQESLANKRPIKYDYELNFEDPKTMSCAEVSQVAFQMASDGAMKIPMYPNNIKGAESLTKRLKIAQGPTYEPGDMEIDPRFELVAEFRDLRLTRDSRQKDAVMSAIFNWMNQKNYQLKDNFTSRMAGGPIYFIRKTFMWPLVKKMLKLDDFSKEVPRNMLQTVALINEIGVFLQTELKKRDDAFEATHGLPMGMMDLYKALEEIREQDLKLYQLRKTRKQAKLHKIFRA